MKPQEILDMIRYPDEKTVGFDDRIPYDDAIAGLEIQLQRKETKFYAEKTLLELRKRWIERQARHSKHGTGGE